MCFVYTKPYVLMLGRVRFLYFLQHFWVSLSSWYFSPFLTFFLRSRVDFWSQMGLLGVSRGIILEPFWRRLRRGGSSGRLGHRKVQFWLHFCGLLGHLWCLFGVFGDVFRWTFCVYRVVWVSCLRGSFLCFLWSISLDFNKLQCNVINVNNS